MHKRVRWHLRQKPDVVSGLLGVFLRAVETTVRQNSRPLLGPADGARIYGCLPLRCPRCGEPMRIIAFILEPPVILPARSPPQGEIQFDQAEGTDEWLDLDQTVGEGGDTN